jgi:DNA-binding NtrC family response regulator
MSLSDEEGGCTPGEKGGGAVLKDIIVIDEEPRQGAVMKEFLECHGYENIRSFDHFGEMMETLTDPGPLLAIVDNEMAGIDGAEMLSRLSQRFGRPVRGIIVTSITTVPREVAAEYPVVEKGTSEFYSRLLTLVEKWTALPAD